MVKINRFSFRKENRQIEKELARSLLLIQGYPIPENTAAEMIRRSTLRDNERFKFIMSQAVKALNGAYDMGAHDDSPERDEIFRSTIEQNCRKAFKCLRQASWDAFYAGLKAKEVSDGSNK